MATNNDCKIPREVEALAKYYQKEFNSSPGFALLSAWKDWDDYKAEKPVSNTAKAIFNKIHNAGGICSEIVWNEKVEEYFQKERTHNGFLCSEIIVNDHTKAHSQGPAASRQLTYPSNILCSEILIN